MKPIPFLFHSHQTWRDNVEPIFRVLPALQTRMQMVACPSFQGTPERSWPFVAPSAESERLDKLLRVTREVLTTRPEVVIAHNRCVTPHLLRSKVPLVVVENTDAPTLEWSRYHLHRENILGVIKCSSFRQLGLHNESYFEGMHQGKLIWQKYKNLQKTLPRPPFLPISEDLIAAKVHTWYSYGAYPCHQELATQESYPAHRDLDFSCIANTNYPRSRTITRHRQEMLQKLRTIRGLRSVITDQRVRRQEYLNILRRSKVCVSPLGLGICHRSFEGVYTCGTVVQPDCSYFETKPDIYRPGVTYKPVLLDLSDLEQCIRNALDNWEAEAEQRRLVKDEFRQAYWEPENLAHLIDSTLGRVLAK